MNAPGPTKLQPRVMTGADIARNLRMDGIAGRRQAVLEAAYQRLKGRKARACFAGRVVWSSWSNPDVE